MAASEKLIRQLANLSDEAVPKLIEKIRSPDRRTRRFASALLIDLHDSGAVGPLRDLLDEGSLDQAQKGDILPVLHVLGAPVDDATFRRAVPDPGRQFRESLQSLLEEVESPANAETLLNSMAGVPPEFRAHFVRTTLVSRADRRLLAVFAALLHHERDDVALTAIDGIERVKEPAAIPVLEERAQYDPSPRVRRAAQSAALRLQVRSADRTPAQWIKPSPLPVAHCFISTIDGSGSQVMFLLRYLPSGDYRAVDLVLNDRQGLKDWFGLRADEATMAEIMDRFAPIDFVEIGLKRARDDVDRARCISLEAGRRLPPVSLLYQGWLEGDDPQPIEHYPMPVLDPGREPRLLDDCADLLALDEFESWYFNPDEVEAFVDRYVEVVTDAPEGQHLPALEHLLHDAITEIVEGTYRRVLPDRLRRQAWLLAQLYEDQDEPLRALAAARAMEAGLIIEHPLLLAMMERSFFNALDDE